MGERFETVHGQRAKVRTIPPHEPPDAGIQYRRPNPVNRSTADVESLAYMPGLPYEVHARHTSDNWSWYYMHGYPVPVTMGHAQDVDGS